MHVVSSEEKAVTIPTPRRRERRRGLGDIVAAVARALSNRSDPGDVRRIFEEATAGVLDVRSVALRDNGNRWPGSASAPGCEALAFDVPGCETSKKAVLEFIVARTAKHGEWDYQLFGQAAQLAAFVVEVERGRTNSNRVAGGAVQRLRRDGAAPLIGSTVRLGGSG